MSDENAVKPRRWLALTLAGLLLGFPLAVALAGLFFLAAPAGHSKVQLTMWLTALLWPGIFAAVYLFRDGWRAWGWLGAGNAAAHAALFLFR